MGERLKCRLCCSLTSHKQPQTFRLTHKNEKFPVNTGTIVDIAVRYVYK